MSNIDWQPRDEVHPLFSRPKSKRPGLLVILGGLVTTALVLGINVGVNVLTGGDFDPIGLYVCFLIPIAAILMGVAAGFGYSFVSWRRGIPVSIGLVIVVFVLQAGAYFLALYADYHLVGPIDKRTGEATPFLSYYNRVTHGITQQGLLCHGTSCHTPRKSDQVDYGRRALEILAFAAGSLIPLLIVGGHEYCDRCRVYLKREKCVLWIRAGSPILNTKRMNHDQLARYGKLQGDAKRAADEASAAIQFAIKEVDPVAFEEAVYYFRDPNVVQNNIGAWIEIGMLYCPRCQQGILKFYACTWGEEGETVRELRLEQIITPELTRVLLQDPPVTE